MKRVLFIIFLTLLLPSYAYAHVANPAETNVTVTAFVGEHTFFLYGYTSPHAKVTLEGIGIFDQTYSNEKGYFEFNNRFSPLSPREACLSSQDQFGRATNPTCLPPFPTGYDVKIGPIILPPTVSLNKEYYLIDQDVYITGQAKPDSEVKVSLFEEEKDSFVDYLARIPAPVEAFSFPELKAQADSRGNYSLRLPSNYTETYRLFTQTSLDNEPSDKSNTLYFQILPIWLAIIRLLLALFRTRLIELIILAQVTFLAIYFLRRYLHPRIIARNRALVLRKKFPLVEA